MEVTAEIVARGANVEDRGAARCRRCLTYHPAALGRLSPQDVRRVHLRRAHLIIPPRTRLFADRRETFVVNLSAGILKVSPADRPDAISAVAFAPDLVGPIDGAKHRVSSLTRCEACCFERSDLAAGFANHPKLLENFLQHCLDTLARSRDDAALLRAVDAEKKVAALLWILARQSDNDNNHHNGDNGGDSNGGGEFFMPFKLIEAAELLGLAAETVSRRIAALVKQGTIAHGSRRAHYRLVDREAIKWKLGIE